VLLMTTPQPIRLLQVGPAPARRAVLTRRVRLLVAGTIAYNVVEAVVAITAGTLASSTALIGFGLDSAVSFFALAAYVTVESVRALLGADRAEHSTVGLVLAAVSLLVMPVLSAAQRRTGRELGSASAVADSKQTLLCTYLSAVLLVGLAVNSMFGWWWADPVAALVIAVVAVKEGREAWRGDACCTPTAALRPASEAPAGACADGCCVADQEA
jgi:divalent metal cation (Fe/Co/Zn/Cd) transporter